MNSLLQAESRIVPKLNCVKKHLSVEKFQEGGHKLSNCCVFNHSYYSNTITNVIAPGSCQKYHDLGPEVT